MCILILSSFSSDTVTVGNETFNRRESVNINIDTIILNSTLNTINYNNETVKKDIYSIKTVVNGTDTSYYFTTKQIEKLIKDNKIKLKETPSECYYPESEIYEYEVITPFKIEIGWDSSSSDKDGVITHKGYDVNDIKYI